MVLSRDLLLYTLASCTVVLGVSLGLDWVLKALTFPSPCSEKTAAAIIIALLACGLTQELILLEKGWFGI